MKFCNTSLFLFGSSSLSTLLLLLPGHVGSVDVGGVRQSGRRSGRRSGRHHGGGGGGRNNRSNMMMIRRVENENDGNDVNVEDPCYMTSALQRLKAYNEKYGLQDYVDLNSFMNDERRFLSHMKFHMDADLFVECGHHDKWNELVAVAKVDQEEEAELKATAGEEDKDEDEDDEGAVTTIVRGRHGQQRVLEPVTCPCFGQDELDAGGFTKSNTIFEQIDPSNPFVEGITCTGSGEREIAYEIDADIYIQAFTGTGCTDEDGNDLGTVYECGAKLPKGAFSSKKSSKVKSMKRRERRTATTKNARGRVLKSSKKDEPTVSVHQDITMVEHQACLAFIEEFETEFSNAPSSSLVPTTADAPSGSPSVSNLPTFTSGSCFDPFGGTCNDDLCVAVVATYDNTCEADSWATVCTTWANLVCATAEEVPDLVGDNNCYASYSLRPNQMPVRGCNDADCQKEVCDYVDKRGKGSTGPGDFEYQYCCDVDWDNGCAAIALRFCPLPSNVPSMDPTESSVPSKEPTMVPSIEPSLSIAPTKDVEPTTSPSESSEPSKIPTDLPSVMPSSVPSSSPTLPKKQAPVLAGSKCAVCGNNATETPCTDLELFLAEDDAIVCPDSQPYCMSEIFQNGKQVDQYKRCVDYDDAFNLWFRGTSDKILCTAFNQNVLSSNLVCHLACYTGPDGTDDGSPCNQGEVPERKYWFFP